jgi:hypothetical protein
MPTKSVLRLLLLSLCAPLASAGGENHLAPFGGTLASRSDLSAYATVFYPTEPYLLDASLMLFQPLPQDAATRPWWTHAHVDVRTGAPTDVLGRTGGVLFRSNTLDFSRLATIGKAFNTYPLLELKLSDFGLDRPIPVTPNQPYSLVLFEDGVPNGTWSHVAQGGIVYHSPFPTQFPYGLLHNVSYGDNGWATGEPIPFATVTSTTPEPTSALLLLAVTLPALQRRRRRR